MSLPPDPSDRPDPREPAPRPASPPVAGAPGEPPGPPADPAPDDDWPRRRRPRLLVAVLGALAIVALLGATLMAFPDGDGGGPGEIGGDDEATAPSPTATSLPPASEEEIRTAVTEISADVEELRGLSFAEPVSVDLADEGEFQQRLLEDFDEDSEQLADAGVLLAALGLIEPEVDVVAAMRELLGGGVVGFYEPETGELVVRGAALTPYVRSTIAHELTHALDDQHFELHRPEIEDSADERGFGFTALVEGSAGWVEDQYVSSFSPAERQASLAEQRSLAGEMDMAAVPRTLVEQITAPYTYGGTFVQALLDAGGQARLDAAFAAPPTTSEQVLEPEEHLAGEEPVEVPAPEVPGEPVDEGVAGQLLVGTVLAGELGQDEIGAVVDGWGGDRWVTGRDGDRSCVALALVGDTPQDTNDLRGAFEEWADGHGDATVTGGEGAFTVEACAG